MRPNKTERLQQLANELKTLDQYDFLIEWQGSCFWAHPDEPRWFGDQGEYLGPNYDEARLTLHSILG